jgi:hypothetical protein
MVRKTFLIITIAMAQTCVSDSKATTLQKTGVMAYRDGV